MWQTRQTQQRRKPAENGAPAKAAAALIYEHLTERSKTDQPLYEDIIQAGLGEPMAQWRMKAVIETLLVEYRLHVEPSTLIAPLTPTECIFAETCGAGLIEDLYRLPDVEEVQVIGADIFLLKGGRMERHSRTFSSLEDVLRLQDRLALCGKKPINERKPFVQSYMWNRSRLVMTRPPYSDVPSIHIRNFIVKDVTLSQLVGLQTLNEPMAELLRLLVRHHASLLIGGGTATGKTTFYSHWPVKFPNRNGSGPWRRSSRWRCASGCGGSETFWRYGKWRTSSFPWKSRSSRCWS